MSYLHGSHVQQQCIMNDQHVHTLYRYIYINKSEIILVHETLKNTQFNTMMLFCVLSVAVDLIEIS